MNKKVLFVCKSNANRSQIAEYFLNEKYWEWTSLSIAWCSDKRGEFDWKINPEVGQWMRDRYWADISQKRIQFLSEISEEVLNTVKKIVFLYDRYDPHADTKCPEVCKKDWMTPYKYLSSRWFEIQEHPLPRAHNGFEDFLEVSRKIKILVDALEL